MTAWSPREEAVLARWLHRRADCDALAAELPGRSVLAIRSRLMKMRRRAGVRLPRVADTLPVRQDDYARFRSSTARASQALLAAIRAAYPELAA